MIVTCGLRSNMDSFTVTCPFWVLVAARKGGETLLVPLMYTRQRSTHVYLVGCFFDCLGQLERRRCFEWSHVLACNVVRSIDGQVCQATAQACAAAFRVCWHHERDSRLLRKTIDVDIEKKSSGEQSDAGQSDGGQSLGGRGKHRRPEVPTTVKKKPKPPPLRVGQVAELAPGVPEQMREAHNREVDAMQQWHTAELKRLEAASKAREDQWRAGETKWETERKSLQDRLLKAPKAQAKSGTMARVSDDGDNAGTTQYLREAAGELHGSLMSAVTALPCTSWLIETLGKEKGQQAPLLRWSSPTSCWKSRVSSVLSLGGLIVVKVRHKEQTILEFLAVVGCVYGPMAVMCPA